MENKIKTMFSFALFLVLSLSLIACTSAALDSSYLVYNNSAVYSPHSHSYVIPNSYVNYATISVRGTSAGESACMTFMYSDGSSSAISCNSVPYLSWVSYTFSNPNPNLNTVSITLVGGTHTYMKDLFVYGNEEGYTGTPTTPETQINSSCGNNVKDAGEECDTGEENGVLCTAEYGSSCNYCSNQCQLKTLKGEYCGDGILNLAYERCDDGNRIDGDKCTNECKKPFEVTVEGFVPIVWQCDNSRVVYDDATGPGRVSADGQPLAERINDYAFEGEQIQWKVLVMDKNGIEKVRDVYATVNDNIEANCMLLHDNTQYPKAEVTTLVESVTDNIGIDPSCNARIDEEQITEFNPETMAYYLCTLTVETPDFMFGQSDINVEVEDMDGQLGTMAEEE